MPALILNLIHFGQNTSEPLNLEEKKAILPSAGRAQPWITQSFIDSRPGPIPSNTAHSQDAQLLKYNHDKI